LQQKAKEMRNRDKPLPSTSGATSEAVSHPIPATPHVPTTEEITVRQVAVPSIQPIVPLEEVDYLQQVRDRRNQANPPQNITNTNSPEITTTQTTDENQAELDYLQKLQRRGKKMKDDHN
jgi:hypothetical protein